MRAHTVAVAADPPGPEPEPGSVRGPGRDGAILERLRAYYREPAVRARILEYLGADGADGKPTAAFVTTSPGPLGNRMAPWPAERLWSAVDRDLELARSVWDRRGLLAHLDLEHVHFDRPWDTFARPARAFALQQPTAEALEALLGRAGVAFLHVLTGRGHHWAWYVGRDSAAFAALAALPPPALPDDASTALLAGLVDGGPPAASIAAQRGLGMVLEDVAHHVLAAVGAIGPVSTQATAVIAGPGPGGREVVSLDLSAFGDPLAVRHARVAFSLYLKSMRLADAAGLLALPPLATVVVPPGMPLGEALAYRRPAAAARLAAATTAVVPDGGAGTLRLVAAYRRSPLARFHRRYYEVEPEPPGRWPVTYDRLDLATQPACVRAILEQPNDRILQPAALQHLVRVLVATGWHPRHVAGLVRSKLERDHGWQPGVHFVAADQRADFYVRLFAGLALLGTDPLVDLNCVSAAEKGLCPLGGCRCNLADLRDPLRARGERWATGR